MMREAVFSILTLLKFTFAAVQMPSHIWLFMTPMDCSTLGFPVLHHVSELTQTHVHWVCDAIQPSCFCCPLLLLPSVFPFIRVFSYESALHIRWPKHWSFSFSISPSSNEYSGLISFRIDWLDILVVQLTLKSLLKHHNLKASILWHSAFFTVQFSHSWASLVAQLVKNPPAMRETRFQSMIRKIPLRRERLPIPVFLPGKFHGQRSLVGYSPWGCKELDMTERLSLHFTSHIHMTTGKTTTLTTRTLLAKWYLCFLIRYLS